MLILHQRTCSSKKLFLKISQYSPENVCVGIFVSKNAVLQPATFLKETPTQNVSCEFCKIFKNSYFEEHL